MAISVGGLHQRSDGAVRCTQRLLNPLPRFLGSPEESKQSYTTVSRLRHCALNFYLQRIVCHPTGLCERCKDPEYLEYILVEFPWYRRPRWRLFHSAQEMGITWSGVLDTLCRSSQKHPRLCKSLLIFIKETGRTI